MKNIPKVQLIAFALAGVLLSPTAVKGSPIGTFSIVGLGNVRVGASFIDFGTTGPVFESSYANCVLGANPGACAINGTTTGSVLVTTGTGSFAGLAITAGTVLDLEDDFAPIGANFSLPGFITLAALPGTTFTATSIPLGVGTPAGCTNIPGNVCTIPGSPFTITNLGGGSSSVALTVAGFATDGIGPESAFAGRYSSQVNLTADQIIAQIASVGWVQSSFSADFDVSPVPESSSAMLLVIGGLLLLGGRRRLSKN